MLSQLHKPSIHYYQPLCTVVTTPATTFEPLLSRLHKPSIYIYQPLYTAATATATTFEPLLSRLLLPLLPMLLPLRSSITLVTILFHCLLLNSSHYYSFFLIFMSFFSFRKITFFCFCGFSVLADCLSIVLAVYQSSAIKMRYSRCRLDLGIRGNSLQKDKYTQTLIFRI